METVKYIIDRFLAAFCIGVIGFGVSGIIDMVYVLLGGEKEVMFARVFADVLFIPTVIIAFIFMPYITKYIRLR